MGENERLKQKPLLPETTPMAEMPRFEPAHVKATSGGAITLTIKVLFWSFVVAYCAHILFLIYAPRPDWQTPEERARERKTVWEDFQRQTQK